MTTITLTKTRCIRCSHDLIPALIRALDEGGLAQCPACGLSFRVENKWLVANGYHPQNGVSIPL